MATNLFDSSNQQISQAWNLDEEKIKSFIKHWKSTWKTKEQIKSAYKKWVSQWVFNLKEKSINDLSLLEEWKQRLSNLWWKIQWRSENVLERLSEPLSENPFMADTQRLWRWVWAAWQVVWWALDIAWEWIAFLTPDVVKDTLWWLAKDTWNSLPKFIQNTAVNAIKSWWEAYSSFKEAYPEIAFDLEWAWNIWSVLIWWPATKTSLKAWERWWELLWKWLDTITPWQPTANRLAGSAFWINSQWANRIDTIKQLKGSNKTAVEELWETINKYDLSWDDVKVRNKAVEIKTDLLDQKKDALINSWLNIEKTPIFRNVSEMLDDMFKTKKWQTELDFWDAKTAKRYREILNSSDNAMNISDVDDIRMFLNKYLFSLKENEMKSVNEKIAKEFSEEFTKNAERIIPDIRDINTDIQMLSFIDDAAHQKHLLQWIKSWEAQEAILDWRIAFVSPWYAWFLTAAKWLTSDAAKKTGAKLIRKKPEWPKDIKVNQVENKKQSPKLKKKFIETPKNYTKETNADIKPSIKSKPLVKSFKDIKFKQAQNSWLSANKAQAREQIRDLQNQIKNEKNPAKLKQLKNKLTVYVAWFEQWFKEKIKLN